MLITFRLIAHTFYNFSVNKKYVIQTQTHSGTCLLTNGLDQRSFLVNCIKSKQSVVSYYPLKLLAALLCVHEFLMTRIMFSWFMSRTWETLLFAHKLVILEEKPNTFWRYRSKTLLQQNNRGYQRTEKRRFFLEYHRSSAHYNST